MKLTTPNLTPRHPLNSDPLLGLLYLFFVFLSSSSFLDCRYMYTPSLLGMRNLFVFLSGSSFLHYRYMYTSRHFTTYHLFRETG